MTDSRVHDGDRLDPVLADPAGAPPGGWTNPRGGYLFFTAFAAIGAGMGSLVPAVLTLALKAKEIDPDNATTILGVVVGIAGLAGLVAFPALGRISDRTTSRLGRRRPFLLLGAALFAIGAVGILLSTNVPLLIVSDVITAVAYSSVMVAVTATIADQFEPLRRGPASAVVGLSLPLGALVGLGIATAVASSLTLQIVLPAVVAVIGTVLLAFRLSDRTLAADERPHFGWTQALGTFFVSPVRYPNFALAWWSRFLIYFGVAALQAYQVFYLIFRLRFDAVSVASGVFLTTVALVVGALVFAPIAAKVSDRVGRRKPFVIVAAVIFAIGLVLAANAHDFASFMIASLVVGIGQGVYFSVDIALVTQILPDPTNPAKDLGIMNLASTLPMAVTPLIAPVVLAIGALSPAPPDQNYSALFLLGAVAGIVGAVLILPIRRVR
ncbi:MFS transporter [uncultured Amnibacterium sp.]|uniref:MFS transporter n=1 Tax=uncultured Amnibacterium sp. TaxID=1631851 RepID=UPI0035CC8635